MKLVPQSLTHEFKHESGYSFTIHVQRARSVVDELDLGWNAHIAFNATGRGDPLAAVRALEQAVRKFLEQLPDLEMP